ncbi:MAG: hypothetical protein KME27_01135 [Lyngbya sp. HA4199-MV5]|nr:hypothetical protein [Lyngbya sp. HA4199-MV5]
MKLWTYSDDGLDMVLYKQPYLSVCPLVCVLVLHPTPHTLHPVPTSCTSPSRAKLYFPAYFTLIP